MNGWRREQVTGLHASTFPRIASRSSPHPDPYAAVGPSRGRRPSGPPHRPKDLPTIVGSRTARLAFGLAAASLIVSACGSRSSTSTASPGAAGSASAATAGKTVKIGIIAPLSGDLSAVGLGIRNSVDLAVKEANTKKTVPGYTLVLAAQDDEGKTGPATNAATALSADTAVGGVIGTLNSSTAQVVQPVLQRSNIALISPSNTNPTLTQGADPKAPKRTYSTYFRVCTTDSVQGPFAADYVFRTLKLTKVATINDTKTYGQGLASSFEARFTSLGGTITRSATIVPTATDFSGTVSQVAAGKPQLVYYGGEYPQAGPLSKQMRNAGLTVPVMGGDGIYSQEYIGLGGRANDLSTSVGAPVESLASGKTFITAYSAASYPQPYGPYGAYAYDAANALIAALAKALPAAASVQAARPAVVTAVQATSVPGVTGTVAFDQLGDATNKTLTVYKVTGGKWVAAQTGTFKQ